MSVVEKLLFGDTVYCSLSRVENGIYYFYKDVRITDIEETYNHRLGFLFMQPPSSFSIDVLYRELISAKLCVYVSGHRVGTDENNVPQFRPIAEKWSVYDMTVGQTVPKWSFEFIPAKHKSGQSLPSWMYTEAVGTEIAQHVFNNGVVLTPNDCVVWTTRSSSVPYLSLTQGDLVGLTITPLYPTSTATITKSLPTTFQWSSVPESENTLDPVSIDSCVLRWRYLDDSSYTEIPLGPVSEYTMPAGTFENGTVEWQIEAIANSGVITTTPWIQSSVAEPLSSAKAVAPQNTVIDGSKPIQFCWEHIISNGTQQKAFEVQISRDLQTWSDLVSNESGETSTTVAENTFTSGDLYWRVRTYNLDGFPGDWSDAAHVIVIAAPTIPSVTVSDAAPKFSIRWHQHDQQGYEISLNGTVIAKKYGQSSAYVHTQHLFPGNYSIKVRIQNKYGLWSSWGEALLFIAESDEPPISLVVTQEDHVAHLRWNTDGAYDGYLVYRNGIKIAEISGHEYIDQFAAGVTEYQIRGVYNASGYCGLSQATQISINIPNMLVAAASCPRWISLAQSVSSLRVIKLSKSRSVTYNHFIGAALPSADIGEAETQALEIDSAWPNTNLSQAHDFEALLGKTVAIKTPTGNSIFAVMDSVHKEENRFWTAYRAQLTPIDWEECPA